MGIPILSTGQIQVNLQATSTDGNVPLTGVAGTTSIDGVFLSQGKLVSLPHQNVNKGIYICAVSDGNYTLTRVIDAAETTTFNAGNPYTYNVSEGLTNVGVWQFSIIAGVSTFNKFAEGQYQPADALLSQISGGVILEGVTYVDAGTGSDATGKPNNIFFPYATIQAAVNNLPTGSSLEVRPNGDLSYPEFTVDNAAGSTVYFTGDTSNLDAILITDAGGEIDQFILRNAYTGSVEINNSKDALGFVYFEKGATGPVTIKNTGTSTQGILGVVGFSNMGDPTFAGIEGDIDVLGTGWEKQTGNLTIYFENVYMLGSSTITLNGSNTVLVFNNCHDIPRILFRNGASSTQVVFEKGAAGVAKKSSWVPTDLSGAGLVFTNTTNSIFNKANETLNFHGELTFPTTADILDAAISAPPVLNAVGTTFLCSLSNGVSVRGEFSSNNLVFYDMGSGARLKNFNFSGLSLKMDGAYFCVNDYGSL
jgi:hypothetical protein